MSIIIRNKIRIIVLAVATLFGFSASINAAPTTPTSIVSPAAELIETVGYDIRRGGLYQRHGISYYNGYRGQRYQRVGNRYYRGHYFPRSAFTVRIYVGPPVVYRPRHTRPQVLRVNNSHVRYCASKYRSYRAYDNTFQPYHGPRRSCRSPFGG